MCHLITATHTRVIDPHYCSAIHKTCQPCRCEGGVESADLSIPFPSLLEKRQQYPPAPIHKETGSLTRKQVGLVVNLALPNRGRDRHSWGKRGREGYLVSWSWAPCYMSCSTSEFPLLPACVRPQPSSMSVAAINLSREGRPRATWSLRCVSLNQENPSKGLAAGP